MGGNLRSKLSSEKNAITSMACYVCLSPVNSCTEMLLFVSACYKMYISKNQALWKALMPWCLLAVICVLNFNTPDWRGSIPAR